MHKLSVAALLISVSVSAFGQAQTPKQAEPAKPFITAERIHFHVEPVVEKVEIPWTILFTPDGRMLFTERPGRVRVFDKGKLQDEPYFSVPDVKLIPGTECGLMGMCLHPDYAKNKTVYLSFSHKSGDVRVVQYTDTGKTFENEKIILKGVPLGGNHAGCRIRFGPDGKLYITTGERFQRDLAQDLGSLGGKILRVNDDGSVPQDNPFVGTKGARPEIWCYGNRNPQGIDWQPGTGLLFETEHGPSGEPGIGTDGDEFNLIERGKNYGWPTIHHSMKKEGMESPLIEWTPAVAPGSGMFYRADAIPALKGDFLVGCLRGSKIVRITLEGRKVANQETLVKGYGRIREVVQGPDGSIYFSTSNRDGRGHVNAGDDHIMRIVPDPQ